jgi:hypothetical protein
MKKPKVIAECIAQAGYGTSTYDRVTHECTYSCYATITKVIKNEQYWKQYDDYGSGPLNTDFDLGYNFKNYHLFVYADGTKDSKQVN